MNIKICLFFITNLFLSCGPSANRCDSAVMYRNDAYDAIVTKKFIDTFNHGEANVSFNDPNAYLFFSYRPEGTEGEVWDYIKVGDTVRKIKGTNTIIIKRTNCKDTLFTLYYGCLDTTVLVNKK